MRSFVRVTLDPDRFYQSFREIENHDIFQVPVSRDYITDWPIDLGRPWIEVAAIGDHADTGSYLRAEFPAL